MKCPIEVKQLWMCYKIICDITQYEKYVLFCTIICIIFTSLCKNFLNLTCVLAEAFRCHGHHSQCLTVKVELAAMFRNIAASSTRTVKHWEWSTWHWKASAKTQVRLRKFLQGEVKIIHIIVQDQDGQNNNIKNYLL